MCQSNHKSRMTLWFPPTFGSKGKDVKLHLTWHEGFGMKLDCTSVIVCMWSLASSLLKWHKMTNFAHKLWHLPQSSAHFSQFQLITHCSPHPKDKCVTNVFYWVITSSAPFIVKEWIVADEHSIKQIMATLCCLPIVLWKSLQNVTWQVVNVKVRTKWNGWWWGLSFANSI